MADFDSSLPIRTQANGDVVAFLADGTINTQLLSIDASGRLTIKLDDGTGNAITSQVNGAQRALDVGINVAGVQIDPRQIRALTAADVVSVVQSTSPWATKDQSDGPVAPGTVASFSQLMGGQFNTVLPTLTNAQQAAVQLDASGRLLVSTTTTDDHNYGTVGANTLRSASQIGNATGAADFNFGAVGAQTLRTAAEVGNSTGAADFNNGATGAQTLRVAANLAVAGANVSAANPVPVTIEDAPGTHINDFKDATATAINATDDHDYTVTAGKTLHLNQITSSASGKAKMTVRIETGVATGVFNDVFVQFNSAATPNMSVILSDDILIAAGVRVRCSMKNRDLAAEDLYSTISGFEL